MHSFIQNKIDADDNSFNCSLWPNHAEQIRRLLGLHSSEYAAADSHDQLPLAEAEYHSVWHRRNKPEIQLKVPHLHTYRKTNTCKRMKPPLYLIGKKRKLPYNAHHLMAIFQVIAIKRNFRVRSQSCRRKPPWNVLSHKPPHN